MLPLLPSGIAVAAVFGMLTSQAGMTAPEAVAMSVIVYAGAAQLVAVGLWAEPLPVLTIVASTLILNLRHLLMSATVSDWLRPISPRRAYVSLATLTDESWALALRYVAGGGVDRAFLLGAGLVLLAAFVAGTAVGRLAGAVIPDPAAWGLDFAFAAAFIALLLPLWRSRRDLAPWLVAAASAYLVWRWLPGGTWHVLVGGLAGAAIAAVRRGS
jgi:4-azaleucine resistance transporter AzlC